MIKVTYTLGLRVTNKNITKIITRGGRGAKIQYSANYASRDLWTPSDYPLICAISIERSHRLTDSYYVIRERASQRHR